MSRIELLKRAIHSAECRIYRINYDLKCDISLTHQRKAENQKELMQITVEALEKQMPKKPTPHIVDVAKLKIGNANWHKNTTVYKCPCCNNFISRLYEFCFKCGQALDWSDTE